MEEIQLKDICDLDNGYAFKSDDYVDNSNTLNCRMSNIRPDGSFDILYSAKYLPDEFAEKYKDYILHDGDLIIAMTDMAGDPKILGVPTVVDTQGFCLLLNQRVGRLRFIRDGVNADYLKFALQCPKVRTYLKRFAGGGVQLNVSKKDILSAPVCMRNEEEQNHIAGLFKRVLEVKTKRERELQLLDDLIKARFVELFGDTTTGNYKYDTKKLGDVADVGSSHRVFTTEFVESGVPFYRGTEIGELANGIKPTEPYYISEEHYNRLANDDTKPQIGDLLMPSICNKGQVWMVDTDEPFYYKDGRVLCISPNREIFDTKYLEYFMRAKTLVEYPKLGSGSTFAEFKIFLLKDIDVLIPPRDMQEQFADFVEQVDKSKVVVQKALDETQMLFDSLMQKYFG